MKQRGWVGLAVIWVVFGVAIAWLLLPQLPGSARQWAWVILLGPPLYVGAEAIAGRLLSPEHGHAISKRRFSPARIGVAMLVSVPLVLAAWALWAWLGRG